ncbi:saccharopine dehydrogenase [Halioglobus maricola]|uniref:Saccharopine dehydrogenase n=1 Tax=Halioglobus maricola TaxID=2601894 RepID=A0A5P9NKC1_9GAMM|nr:saccharopine dehydrogenase NADP-binding domain-containing protein [Halioglobus maricola]QFU76182.1 saccharopine dehydrogenase [Halioglobus maricola]
MKDNREFDVVIYGASGFTGQLIAEYLASRAAQESGLRWAIAGRSADKVAAVAAESGLPADLPIIAADSADLEAMNTLASRTKVILTSVGPYQLYGSLLVEACATNGTDYVDLCGEPNWMREMIDKHQEAAQASGARIVFSCGFDSIPSDLGVHYLQTQAKAKFGTPLPQVRGRVRAMNGGASGGTVASMQATMVAAMENPAVGALLKNPFGLANPEFDGPKQPSSHKPCFDEGVGSWAAPFVMAVINIPNVHRSNFVQGFSYGENFTYSEMILTGPGEKGEKIANAMAVPSLTGNGDTPQPGEGPSREEQVAGNFDILFIGENDSGDTLRVSVTGDRDPGYGSTSRMISEAALTLAMDNVATPGGIWTPAAALGDKLIDRLGAHAGLEFKVE